jgi:hypothetical protein
MTMKSKKLSLGKQTIRELTARALDRANGGGYTNRCDSALNNCPDAGTRACSGAACDTTAQCDL